MFLHVLDSVQVILLFCLLFAAGRLETVWYFLGMYRIPIFQIHGGRSRI